MTILSLISPVEEEVTDGSIAIKLKYGILTVLSKTVDLCDAAKEAKLMCPINAGSLTFSTSATIPSIAPGVS